MRKMSKCNLLRRIFFYALLDGAVSYQKFKQTIDSLPDREFPLFRSKQEDREERADDKEAA